MFYETDIISDKMDNFFFFEGIIIIISFSRYVDANLTTAVLRNKNLKISMIKYFRDKNLSETL